MIRTWKAYKSWRPLYNHWYSTLWAAMKWGKCPTVEFMPMNIDELKQKYPQQWEWTQRICRDLPEGTAEGVFLDFVTTFHKTYRLVEVE